MVLVVVHCFLWLRAQLFNLQGLSGKSCLESLAALLAWEGTSTSAISSGRWHSSSIAEGTCRLAFVTVAIPSGHVCDVETGDVSVHRMNSQQRTRPCGVRPRAPRSADGLRAGLLPGPRASALKSSQLVLVSTTRGLGLHGSIATRLSLKSTFPDQLRIAYVDSWKSPGLFSGGR